MKTEKTEKIFQDIKSISDVCFTGVEKPPELALRFNYDHCDLFTTGYGSLIMAFAMVTIDRGQPFIWMIATEPTLRKHGFGTQLLKEIIHYYSLGSIPDREYPTRIDLTVNVNNPAQKLYFDFGWRATKVIPKYYGEASGLRMRRTI
jgi:ribosomal protein S18 acetylase RimI-like enzyme